MTYLDYLEQKVLLERLVIGLEEPVLIKGLGELSAKIDSGNGGYNVIHGTDFHQQGSELMFTTHDSFGHEKKMQATVIDTIEVNMGGGNIESRPVIELDIKFAGEDYKKIPFSVSDRSSNTNPILISKGFVENELEALIDVGAMNISNDKIDVVYGESWLKGGDNADLFSPIKSVVGGTAKGIKAVAGGAKDFVKGTYNVGKTVTKDGAGLVKGAYGAGKTAVGDTVGITKGLYNAGKTITSDLWGAGERVADAFGGVTGRMGGLFSVSGMTSNGIRLISSLAKKISFAPNLTMGDLKEIRKRIASVSNWVKTLQKLHATDGTILKDAESINPKETKILPIVSFSCQKGVIGSDKINWTGNVFGLRNLPKAIVKKTYVQGQKGRAESWKKEIEAARKGVEYLKSTGDNTQTEQMEEQEEELLESLNRDISILLSEADENQQPMTQTPPQEPQESEVQNDQQEGQVEQQSDDQKQEELITNFDDLSLFQLWFIPISSKEDAIDVVINTFISNPTFDSMFSKLYDSGKVTVDSVGAIVKNISSQIKKMPAQKKLNLQGMWCLAISPDQENPENRDYHFFQEEPYLIYVPDGEISPSNNVNNKELKEQVISSFTKAFPNVQNAIVGLENTINKDTEGLITKIIDGEAFQNELSQSENFPKLSSSINQIKKLANHLMENKTKELSDKELDPKEHAVKALANHIRKNPQLILTPFIHEYTVNELNKSELGKNILDLIAANGGELPQDVTSFDKLINLILNSNDAIGLLNANNEKRSQEDEEWIEQKLNFIRQNKMF